MIKSYFVLAYRNIIKNKFYSALNIFGPATVVPFIVSLLVTLIIAVITISSLSVKAARVNPIETLSRE